MENAATSDLLALYTFTGRARLYARHISDSLKHEFTHTLRVAKDWVSALDDLSAAYHGWGSWGIPSGDDRDTIGWALDSAREARFQFGSVLSRNVYKAGPELDALSVEVVDAAYSAARRMDEGVRLLAAWQARQLARLSQTAQETVQGTRDLPFHDCPYHTKLRPDLRDDLRGQIVKFRVLLNRAESRPVRLPEAGQGSGEDWVDICMTSRRAVRLLHCLLTLAPTQVRPEMVAELLQQYDRAVPLVPQETAFRRSIERRRKRLVKLFPPPVTDQAGYRREAFDPRQDD